MRETGQTPPPLSARAVFLFSQLGFHVAERCAELLAPLGLHPAHFGVLSSLAGADGRTQQDLADALDVHRNVMVGLIDALEGQGLVRRERHPGDRRAYDVYLTGKATDLLSQAAPILDGLEAEVLAPLDPAERAQLTGLLHRLTEHNGLPADVHPGIRRRRLAEGQRPLIRPPRA